MKPSITARFDFEAATWIAKATTGEQSEQVHLVPGGAIAEVCKMIGVERSECGVFISQYRPREIHDAMPEHDGVFGV